ncbi:MAG TPA: hypothetical protein VIJ26_07400 [Thermoanaerobaculia bacterium]|jgi:hypothetical protein
MRRRLWTLATLLLLALAAVPRPAAAGERAAVRPVKAASAAFWEGLRHLPFLAPLRKLGAGIDPAGAPKPSSPPGGTSIPQGDLGPGIDPWG